ncbi:MAG: sodium/proton-translocating pyrophosphatase, partial [Thiotrichaceae bacterium]|nr:sodium/proton-translocating pyrophosphatase [Thiotrichaceae bacterium]
MSVELMFAFVAGIAAVAYGIVSIKWIMSKSPGSDTMLEIAQAVQDGAQAYLNRQYKTIGMVGAVVFVAIFAFIGAPTAIGFLIGAVLS